MKIIFTHGTITKIDSFYSKLKLFHNEILVYEADIPNYEKEEILKNYKKVKEVNNEK
jgi:hypothetical protein